MLAALHVQILAQIRMHQRLEHLRLPQNRNRIGRQWQTVAAAHVARMRFRKERECGHIRSGIAIVYRLGGQRGGIAGRHCFDRAGTTQQINENTIQ